MASSWELVEKVCNFLRIDPFDNALVIEPLILAAKQYLTNAGVTEPTDGELDLYELAVTLYVNMIFSGNEDKLETAMTGIILQLKD